VHRLGQLVPGYRRIRRPDDGIDPEFHFYRAPEEQDGILRRVLLKLEAEGFPPRDIVVLSPFRNCAASRLAEKGSDGDRFQPYSDGASGVRWATIHSFKGLEAPAIILTDIDDVESTAARDLFYIGLTRSVQRLVICAANAVAGPLFTLLQKS
jgi:superfamily I DNA/RNA helicase